MTADSFGQKAPGDLLIPGLGRQRRRQWIVNVFTKFGTFYIYLSYNSAILFNFRGS